MRLKEVLNSHNFKNKDIISELQIDETVFYDWKNETVLPSFANLIKIADFFALSIDYIMGRTDDFGEYHTKQLIPFAENLQNILASKHISKYRFFKDCGFDNSLKTSWFKNGTKPNVGTLMKMANYLDVSMDELMGRQI